jgi:hypothetical protein
VRFSLGGNQGLNIFDSGYPLSREIYCDTGAPLDDVEETMMDGVSRLIYVALTGRYIYIWKTDKAWSDTCRQLVIKFIDGSVYLANFKFVR